MGGRVFFGCIMIDIDWKKVIYNREELIITTYYTNYYITIKPEDKAANKINKNIHHPSTSFL